jgi:capsular polysaccharide export protein
VAEHVPVGKITPAAVAKISAYHLSEGFGAVFFPRYRAPYPYTPLHQAVSHVRRYAAQRLNAKRFERDLHAVLAVSGPIFLALLQRPGDSQLVRHSPLGTVAAFIEHVLSSFARHAPPGVRLLFKAHPLDHGIERHETVLQRAAEAHGVGDRIFHTDVGHFPSLVRAAVGVVSVNSTGGLTAIEFQRPTAVLGTAIYDMPGLTHQAGLDRFWTAPEAPDPALYQAFRNVVMAMTQVNGAYSTRHGVSLAAPEVTRRLLGS